MTNGRSSTHDALMLSEIRTHVGRFLMGSKKDLIVCMLVCKSWRADFRRLLYHSLELTKRTLEPILLPSQWRSYSPYTHSLTIAEPTTIYRGKQLSTIGSKAKPTNVKDGTTMRSPDYNLDPAIHCPNLLHLTVKVNPKLLPLSCWTKQDAWCEVDENAITDEDQEGSLFRTSAVVRYDVQLGAFLVKTSNRILALLHHHPRLQTFRWIGASETHMDQLGRYLFTRQHQFVELQLQQLKSSIPELNQIIANCPWLRRLHLNSLILEAQSSWPELASSGSRVPQTVLPSAAIQPSQPCIQPNALLLLGIQTLTLEGPRFPLLKVHIDGPSLETLYLSNCCFPAGFNPITQPTDPLMDPESTPSTTPVVGVHWNCPRLKTYRHEGGASPHMFVHHLLDSCQDSLTSLTAVKYTFDTDFVPTLIGHAYCQRLTFLDLRNSTWIRSTEVQLLLCHCSELIEFTGPQSVLWGEDLMQSTLPWACLKLKKLQQLVCLARPDSDMWERGVQQGKIDRPLSFPLQRILSPEQTSQLLSTLHLSNNAEAQQGETTEDSTSNNNLVQLQDVQDAIYGQLARLTQLEVLDLSGGGSASLHFLVEYPLGIPWTLDAGLARLSGLSKMVELVVTGWEDKMTRKEARWLKQHWPELRSIVNKDGHSTLNTDDDKKPDEEKIVGWLAFEMCLAQEWPERFPDYHIPS
ncbi:MAG: hypothetical protein J3Q66DRAFT_330757 [Benniella sp.]|nr:MAG: hypothetical protein J3Q66DRAFT_330757 [Benniella sp.]